MSTFIVRMTSVWNGTFGLPQYPTASCPIPEMGICLVGSALRVMSESTRSTSSAVTPMAAAPVARICCLSSTAASFAAHVQVDPRSAASPCCQLL